MDKFENLFGIKKSEVKDTCVLLPLLGKGTLSNLGAKEFSKGKLYSSGQGRDFTAIVTGIGAGLAGDAVLYLKETGCQKIILFGSCGLVEKKENLTIGSLVSAVASYSLEGFSDMLSDREKEWRAFPADGELTAGLLNTGKIQKVTAATLGSLKLEEDYPDIFRKNNIDIVDMECSAVFSASQYIERKAAALFYVTDIINEKPFYSDPGGADKSRIHSSAKAAAHMLCEFIKNNPAS